MAVIAPPADRPRLQGPAARPRWHAHRLDHPALYHLAAAVARAFPRGARLRTAAATAPRLRHLFRAEWNAVNANLTRIAPGAGAQARTALVAEVFRHFAMCFSDLIVANRRQAAAERLLGTVDGADHLEAAAARGRGLIVLTAHLGNWELAGRLVAGHAARPTHVVVEAEPDARVERFLRGGPAPVRFVPRAHPTVSLHLLAALRRGEIVAMQGDRALGTRGDVEAPFFGTDAAFPLGPFVLARASGASIVPAFCLLRPDRRYSVVVRGARSVEAATEHEALREWVEVLESVVRAHPEQWFNFFDPWGGRAR